MKKFLLTILVAVPAYSYASFGIGYTSLDLDMGDGDSLSIGALSGSYTFSADDSPFSLQTGVLIGITDDTLYGVKAELDPSFYLKGIYDINENIFINVNWAKYEATASAGSESISGSDSEAGFGFGFNVGKAKIMFDFIEDTDMFSIQYNF